MRKIYYLATEPDGEVFLGINSASAGTFMYAMAEVGLIAASRPDAALRAMYRAWPCALWEVSGTPEGEQPYPKTLTRFETLKVLRAIDPALALGPCREQVTGFFDAIGALGAGDLRPASTVDEDWYAARDRNEFSPELPAYQRPGFRAQIRSRRLAAHVGLDCAQTAAARHAAILGERAAEHLLDPKFRSGTPENPAQASGEHLSGACYDAACALSVSDRLSRKDFALLTEDWRRITGQTLSPAPRREKRGAMGRAQNTTKAVGEGPEKPPWTIHPQGPGHHTP